VADKVFVVIASQDKEVVLEPGLLYPFNAVTKGWMQEVKIIFFGPSEKLAAADQEVQDRLKEAMSAGIPVMACKRCADGFGLTGTLEALGLEVIYVGDVISDLLKEGWARLTF
jgi:hypothetical protein